MNSIIARIFLVLVLGLTTGCITKKQLEDQAVATADAPAADASAAPEAKKPGFSIVSLFGQKKPKPPQAVPPQLVGTIKMVNKEDKFVLIDAVSFSSIQAGDAMVSISEKSESARLRAGKLRNPPFLIADIASGDPEVGDKVYKN